ncbi:hypothetical protein [Schlesneria paludicola]|uniref:hypothetical protein n=1 Tax=Schlesneria paludicola TaxID=360056 RepID=UPI001ED8FA8B|nr:hypothetical protein [Schlesneria paludicola]
MALLTISILPLTSPAWGQPIPVRSTSDTTSKPDFQYKVVGSSNTGPYTYAPETWGDLRINLVNARSESREVLCTTYFDQDPSLQYGRQVWLPKQSILRTSHPILVPKCDPAPGRNLNLRSLILDASESNEVMIRNESGQRFHDAAILVAQAGRNTAVFGDSAIASTEPGNEIADLIVAGRVGQQLTNRFTILNDPFLPADESVLKTFDHLILADGRITDDFAATTALRAWLHAGGNLWVMLDQVDPVVLKRLLGDDFSGHVVDRVGLTSVRIDKASALTDTEMTEAETVDYDDPVDLVRIVNPSFTASYSVNGWPVAMTKACGDGKLLLTTLGARAWVRPRPESMEQPTDPLKTSNVIAASPLTTIARDFFSPRNPPLLPLNTIEPQVREYIGYTIPSWGAIVGTLLGFSLCILALGTWLNLSGRLEHVSWMGSILAIIVSAGLIMIGRTSRQAIPPTLASVQFIQGIRGTDEIRTEGLLSIFQPEGSQATIEVTNGGRMIPDMTGLEGTSRRMITTDLGTCHWENLPQAAGLRSTSFTQSQTVIDRLQAHATFNSNGVVGKYSGQLPVGSDAILATRNGRMGVALKADGTFIGRAEDIFERDQFLSAGLLSDEQNRRRRTLESLLTNPKRKDYPDRPQLMFWSEPWDNGFRFGEGLARRGTSLVALPLVLERPASGTEIFIPSPFLNYFNRRNPDGSLPSTMWDATRNEWQERSTPGLSWLNFMIPRELLPLTLRRARIDLKVAGPVGRVEIFGLKDGSVISLKTVMDPVGSLSIEISDADSLTLDDEGRLSLGLSAGDPNRPELTHSAADQNRTDEQRLAPTQINQSAKVNYWRIESLALQLWASTAKTPLTD